MENTNSHFSVSKSIHPINLIVEKILDKYMMGIAVIREGGELLYFRQFNDKVKIERISNFVKALTIFGQENTGKIKRIFLEGPDLEMKIVAKHNLILIMVFTPNMVQDYLDEEAERGLDIFEARFRNELSSGVNNTEIYGKFDDTCCQLVYEYLVRIGIIKMH